MDNMDLEKVKEDKVRQRVREYFFKQFKDNSIFVFGEDQRQEISRFICTTVHTKYRLK